MWLIFSLLVLGQVDTNQTDTPLFPSLNHWEMSFMLLKDPRMATSLHVDHQQLALLNDLRSRPPFKEAFERKMASQREQHDTISRVLASLDIEIRAELKKIFTEDQLSMLRPAVLRDRFRNGVAPFFDGEVIESLGLAPAEKEQLKLDRAEAQKEYDQGRQKLISAAVQRILAELGADARQKFVDIAGNDLIESLTPNEVDLNIMPVPPEFFRIEPSVVYDTALIKKLQLSPTQEKGINLLEKAYLRENDSIRSGQLSLREWGPALKKLDEKTSRSLWDLLEPKQKVTYFRLISTREFIYDFRRPFRRKAFVDYLGLEPNEVEFFREITEDEFTELETKLVNHERETFQSLCSKLPIEKRKRLLETFRGVFEMVNRQ